MKNQIILILSFFLISCHNPSPESLKEKNRTVVVYMTANNNLNQYALEDINEMELGWDKNFDGTLLVYLNGRDGKPRLIEISKDDDLKAINSRTIKEYTPGQDAVNPATLTQILNDATNLRPARNYGLILWSHGSGWLPEGIIATSKGVQWKESKIQQSTDGANGVAGYSFGYNDQGSPKREMEINDLVAAIPADLDLEFIASDACHMSSIEMAYAMRNKSRYLIASAAEILVAGFPYEKIVGYMFEPKANVVSWARTVVDYYKTKSGDMRSITMSVVDTHKLDALAKQIEALGIPNAPINYASIQQFGRFQFRNTFYDLKDFINKAWYNASPEKLALAVRALDESVLYAESTEWMFGDFQVRIHCGLTAYIPRKDQPALTAAYKKGMIWGDASGLNRLVP